MCLRFCQLQLQITVFCQPEAYRLHAGIVMSLKDIFGYISSKTGRFWTKRSRGSVCRAKFYSSKTDVDIAKNVPMYTDSLHVWTTASSICNPQRQRAYNLCSMVDVSNYCADRCCSCAYPCRHFRRFYHTSQIRKAEENATRRRSTARFQ